MPEQLVDATSVQPVVSWLQEHALITPGQRVDARWRSHDGTMRDLQAGLEALQTTLFADAEELEVLFDVDLSRAGVRSLFSFGKRSGSPRAGYQLGIRWSHFPRVPRFALSAEAEVNCQSCWTALIEDTEWGGLGLDPQVHHRCPRCGFVGELANTPAAYAHPSDTDRDPQVVPCAVYRLALVIDTGYDWPMASLDEYPISVGNTPPIVALSRQLNSPLVELGGYW